MTYQDGAFVLFVVAVLFAVLSLNAIISNKKMRQLEERIKALEEKS